jgi:hypothetical protein
VLQYQEQAGSLWHNIAEFAPGQNTELGGGALFLPKEVNLRVIKKPKEGSSEPPTVVLNYGRLGNSLSTLFVPQDACSSEPEQPDIDNNTKSKRTNFITSTKWTLSPAIVIPLIVVTLVSLVLAIVALRKCFKK